MCEIKFYKNYKNIDWLREGFLEFTPKALYGISFRPWYERGCWGDKYIPYSLVRGDKMIANVSISELQILLGGKIIRGIQFATVGTLPEYRNRGYSRELMNRVLSDYADKADLFFLFANDTVLDFYPKFGFHTVEERLFTAEIDAKVADFSLRKLDLKTENDLELLRKIAANRLPVTKQFGAMDYDNILLWYALRDYADCFWYSDKDDLIVVYDRIRDRLAVYDILCAETISFKKILPQIADKTVKHIDFYFTPELLDISTKPAQVYKDSPLFVRGEFALDSEPFKFPVLAQT